MSIRYVSFCSTAQKHRRFFNGCREYAVTCADGQNASSSYCTDTQPRGRIKPSKCERAGPLGYVAFAPAKCRLACTYRHKCLRALTRSARPGCVGAPNVVSQLSEESRLTYSVVAVSSARQTILDIGVELMLLYVIVNLSTETLCLWYCHSTFRYINSMAPLCCSLIVLIIISSRRKIHIMVPRRPP